MRPIQETVILRGGVLRRQKLTQHMFVVGDYLSDQASVGLSQEVVKRRHVSRAEAASLRIRLSLKFRLAEQKQNCGKTKAKTGKL